ncbi:MAG: hypothetical protein MR024_03855 [Firmicutes bacterium]|nr:hypothetical protein [Bacillota bacterium]
MMFKNSMKLLFANFSTIWKTMVYYILVTALFVGLLYPVWGLLGEYLNADGAMTKLFDSIMSINIASNLPATLSELYVGLSALFNGILTLFTTNVWLAIYISFIVFYLIPFLYGLTDLPIQETLFGYMSSLTKYGYAHSFVRKLGKSALLQLFKCLIMLPFSALIVFIVMQILSLATLGGAIIYILPFLLIISICVFFAFKRTLFSGWIPAIVVYDCNIFVGLSRGFKAVFRRFWKILSNALIIMLILFGLNYIFGLPAIFIIGPLSNLILNIFEMVMFYESQGMRYYVDLDTIVTPKKLEESDSFRKTKNII